MNTITDTNKNHEDGKIIVFYNIVFGFLGMRKAR
jgi:hypothetical protein